MEQPRTARRGFLALVGSAVFNGAVMRSVGAEQPTLILPPSALLPGAWPLLDACRSPMEAYLDVASHVPKSLFFDWLENGLQLAARHSWSPAALAREERRIEAAVTQHGGIIEAIRAGAI